MPIDLTASPAPSGDGQAAQAPPPETPASPASPAPPLDESRSHHPNGQSADGPSRSALEYELARLPRDVTTAIIWYMEEEGISQRELARRMKVTPGRVSQILSGDENLTLRTLAAVCVGLVAHFEVDLVSNTSEERAQNGAVTSTPVPAPAPIDHLPDPPASETISYTR